MSVLIVIPTVTGREDLFLECFKAYKDTLDHRLHMEIWAPKNYSTCGQAWNEGVKRARIMGYDYVHMTADDLIPHAGWYEAAVETVNAGRLLPGALIYRPDGSLESFGNQIQDEWSELSGGSVPFCRTDEWIDIPNIHYWSDNAFDYAQKVVNTATFVARTNYAFTHYTAQAGRKDLSAREKEIFEEWKKTL